MKSPAQYLTANALSDNIFSLIDDRPPPLLKRSLHVSNPNRTAAFSGSCERYFTGFSAIHSAAMFLSRASFWAKFRSPKPAGIFSL